MTKPALRPTAVCLYAALALVGVARGEDSTFPLHRDTVVRLATVEQGQQVLESRDAFARSLSRFDLQSRLDTRREATTDDLLQFAAGQVLPWSDEDARRVAATVASLRRRLEPLADVFPPEVLLIHTTGREEGGAAYTRGTAIVLPTSKIRPGAKQLERLLTHELFHVLSRHDAQLRKRLYAIVGFTVCDEIPLPQTLRDRKITNPDAPRVDCTIRLRLAGEAATCAPLLIASAEQYEPGAAGGFFKYLQFRLAEVEPNDEGFALRQADGQWVLHKPEDADDYFDQIGRNTRYIIHPDEILADNFVHLVMQRENLDTPRIIDAMAKVLTPG